MILDNADDPTVFLDPCKGRSTPDIGDLLSLSILLPQIIVARYLNYFRKRDRIPKSLLHLCDDREDSGDGGDIETRKPKLSRQTARFCMSSRAWPLGVSALC